MIEDIWPSHVHTYTPFGVDPMRWISNTPQPRRIHT